VYSLKLILVSLRQSKQVKSSGLSRRQITSRLWSLLPLWQLRPGPVLHESLVPIMGTYYNCTRRMELSLRTIKIKKLRDFWSNPEFSDSEQPLKSWYVIAKSANWATPQDVKSQFGNASIVKDNRVVFNIAGNKYRLIVKFNYEYKIAYIRFLGTHKQYDAIDAEAI
jgi:mRNA interferase HigB